MIWRVAALSAAACAWFYPQLSLAQDEPEEKSKEVAPASSESTIEKEAPAPASAPSSSGKGLLGDFRIGPSVALGFPHPLTGGVDAVYAETVSVSVSTGRFNIKKGDTEAEIRNWDVAVHWYPFHGSFFMGAAYGSQGIVGKAKKDVKLDYNGIALTVPTTIRLEIESKYLTPQFGWFARWDSGFTLGFDMGYQIPSGVSTELQSSFDNVSSSAETLVRTSKDYTKAEKDVLDVADLLGKKSIPYINFLKMGWLF